MKRTINILSLMIALSSGLLAQEEQIFQKPIVVEVTSDKVSALETINATVFGRWSDTVVLENANQSDNLLSQDGWISLSPPIIGEKLNDVHTFNENTAIIIGDDGAVYKTTDRGSNWNKISSETRNDLNAVFFLDESKGWIVGTSGTILKTEDGGDSWRAIETNLYTLYDVHFTDANSGWIITKSRIYKTTDGGDNWVEKFASTEATYFFESIAFCNANTGIAVGSLSKMYRTTDAGETWKLIETGVAVWKYDVKFIDASHGWMAGLQASRITISVGWQGTTIDIDNPRYTLWETSNGGATWTQLSFAYSGRLYGVYFNDLSNGWAVGTNGAVFHTEDGGTNWSGTRSVHDMYAVHFYDTQFGWAVGLDGTILHTNNSGNLWTLQSGNGTTSNLNTVHFNDSQTGWAGGYRGKMLHTTNGGELWFEQDLGTSSDLESIFFINDQKGYAVFGWYPGIRYTTNGGVTWKNISGPPPSFDGLNCVYFVDDQNGWIVGNNGDIMHTTNGGTSWGNWSRQTSGTNEELNSVYFVDPVTGWAVGDKGTIIHTDNGGNTWTPQEAGLTDWDNLKSVYFIDSMHGFIVGSSRGMLQTNDGGMNWKARKIEDNSLYSVNFADEQTGWAVGNGGTILKTTDRGNTWGIQKSGTTKSLQSVHFVDTQTGYIVGVNGTIIKTTTGGGLTLYPPTLSSPSEGSTDISTRPALNWNASSGATSYRLQVSTSPTFSWTVVDQSGITGTSYQITELENSTQYYWRVNAMYDEGESNWSNVWSFTTIIVPPPAPLLSSPSNGADNQQTTLWLKWQYVQQAKSYQLQVATDPLFTTTIYDDSSIIGSSRQVDSLDINTAYYWRVRAKNAFVYGPWSNVWSFTTISGAPSAPMLSRPSNGADNQPTSVYLDWDASAGAETYHLQLATDSIFTATVFDDSSMSYTSKRVEPLAVNTTYYWRVRAKNAIGTSPWSAVWRFTTISGVPSTPMLSRPSDGVDNQPTSLYLNWDASEGAESYHLQVATDSIFTATVFDDSSMSYTSKRVGPLVINTTYYWRVRAKNVLGTSAWSSVWRFSTISGAPPAPALYRPSNGAINQQTTLTLSWHSTTGAESYHLQVATDSIFTATVFDDSSMSYTSKRVEPLAVNTTYYWRVKARNALGASPWSGVWSFTTISTAPITPTLSSPSNGAVNQPTTLYLEWDDSEGAETYHLQVATDSVFTAIVFDDSRISYPGKEVGPLAINTTYYWRVRAKNALGTSPWSGVWSFTTISATPAIPVLSRPSNGADNQTTTLTLRWNSTAGAETYHLQVATDSVFTAMVFEDSSFSYPSERVGPLAINTTYYWRVRAKNALGTSPWSGVWSFTTISAAPITPTLSSPSNGAVNQLTALRLYWDDSEGAETYHLQVATDSVFTAMVLDDSNISYPSKRVGPLAINTTYYWRVRAKNALGTSPWSGVWSFTTISATPAIPVLSRPSNGADNQPTSVYLDWNASAGAETYHFQVATDSIFTATVFDDSSISYTSKRVEPLAINTTYYWRVRAKNVIGTSPWSGVWSFTTITGSPSQVLLISPLNLDVVSADSVRFFWQQSTPAIDQYWFELATDSLMANAMIDSMLMATDTTKIVRQLLDKQTYWWRVKAKNVLGWGPFSEQRRFRIDISTSVQTYAYIPREFSLSQNYPNPFNPETVIQYQLPKQAEVRLQIYNVVGELVSTLVDEKQPAGYYSLLWNGKGEHGHAVVSGVYVYRLKADEFVQVRKMILVR